MALETGWEANSIARNEFLEAVLQERSSQERRGATRWRLQKAQRGNQYQHRTWRKKKQVSQPAYHVNLAFGSGAPGWDTMFFHHRPNGESVEYPISTC